MKKMKLLTTGLASVAAVALLAGTARAEVVGYNSVTVPPSSDAVLSVPFNRSAEDTGTVTSAADSTHLTDTSATWVAGEWTNTPHYVRMTSGISNGKWSTIANNTTDTLTLATGLSVANPDTYRIEEHRTLGNAFPSWLEGTSFILSAGTGAGPSTRRTQVMLYNEAIAQINRAPAETYFFGTNNATGFWRKTTASAVNANNTILKPQQSFVVRNINTNTTLNIYTLGEVTEGQLAATVLKSASVATDAPVSSDRPVPMSLAELDLSGTSAFVGSASGSASPTVRKDQILIPDNAASGVNKAPSGSSGTSGTYFYRTDLGFWVKSTATAVDVSTNKVIQPGQGFWIRSVTNNVTTPTWSHDATY